MAFIPIPDTVEININQTLHGEQVQNTLYAYREAGWDAATAEELAGEMIVWVGDSLYPLLSSNIFLTEVAVRDLTTASGIIFNATPTTPVTGGLGGPALPGNVAVVASFRTGFAGRSYRGRNYVAGWVEADVTGNAISPTVADALAAAYEVLMSPTGPMGVTESLWVVASRYANNAPRAEGIATLIRSVLVDQFVDSQRRRLAGRGA